MSDYGSWNHTEKHQAKRDGATVVPNSGRNYLKGDAELGPLLIDYKFTEAKSFSVNEAAMRKHERDAFKTRKIGVEVVCFMGLPYVAEYAVISWDALKELIEREH